MNTKGIGEHMSLIGLSNKTEDPTHPAKSTKPELSVVRPDYLVVDGGFLPSQTNFGGSSGESSLPQPDPPDPTVMYNLQCSGFSVLSLFLSLKALSHSLNLSTSPICADPHWYLNIAELSTSIIANLRRPLNLHHHQSAPSSQPPSSSICVDLSTSIITNLQVSSIHHCRFAISAIHHLWSASQGCSFQLFSLYFFVSVSCKSSFYLCSLDLWVTGVWVCKSILQCRFVF